MTVLVTGGGRGLGRWFVDEFARRGAAVGVIALHQPGLPNRLDTSSGRGTVRAVCANVGEPAEVTAAIDRLVDELGTPHVAVNNAGVVQVDHLIDLPIETWRAVFRVNVEGSLLVTQACARYMLDGAVDERWKRRGLFINVSSGAAIRGQPLLAAYGASKAALDHLTMSTTAAFVDQSIGAVAIYPSNYRGGMWRDLGARIAQAEGRDRSEVEDSRHFGDEGQLAALIADVAALPGLQLASHVVDDQGQARPLH